MKSKKNPKTKQKTPNTKLPPCLGFQGEGGKKKKKTSEKKIKHQQAIRLIFSKPGLWDHCLVFARAQAVCPEGPTF